MVVPGSPVTVAVAVSVDEPFEEAVELTVLIVLGFGILLAPTGFGRGVVGVVGQLASAVNDAGR